MKVIKNYKKLQTSVEEFPHIKILDQEDVFADLPFILAEYNTEYNKPVLYIHPTEGTPIALEEQELLKLIEGTKRFFLIEKEHGILEEVPQSESTFAIRLPIETPVNKLVIMNGEIGMLDDAPKIRGDK